VVTACSLVRCGLRLVLDEYGGCRLLIEVSLAVYEHMYLSVVVRLSEWAEREGVHYQTAWRWFRDGQLPVPAVRTPSGTILVEVPRSGVAGGTARTVL
jgi:hypothetical protein